MKTEIQILEDRIAELEKDLHEKDIKVSNLEDKVEELEDEFVSKEDLLEDADFFIDTGRDGGIRIFANNFLDRELCEGFKNKLEQNKFSSLPLLY